MKTSSRILLGAALAGLALSSLHAVTIIDFDTAQGYTTGNLAGQPTSGAKWTTSNATAFQVNAPAGTVTYNTAGGNWRGANYGEVLSGSATAFAQTADFTFVRGGLNPSAVKSLFRVSLTNSTSTTTMNGVGMNIQQINGNDNFQIQLFESIGTSSFLVSTAFSGTTLGLATANVPDTTDSLRLTMETTWVSLDNWTTKATLLNVSTSTQISTITLNWAADPTWTSSIKYHQFDSEQIADLTGSSVDISQMTIGAVPEPTTWALLAGSLTTVITFRRRRRS